MSKLLYKLLSIIFVFLLIASTTVSAIEDDDITKELLKHANITNPQTNLNYNYESFERVPIKLEIVKPISTKKGCITEGQVIDFIVKEDVRYNSKIVVKKGAKVTAKVQTAMDRGMNGVPATLIIDDFNIEGIDKNKLKATYIKRGQNRTLIVLPIKWALTLIPFAGYVSNLIIGGHANIKKKNTIILFYYPNWGKQ